MDETNNFEQISFNPFSQKDSVFKDIYDPDLNFFDELNSDTPYIFQKSN